MISLVSLHAILIPDFSLIVFEMNELEEDSLKSRT